ncbi:MAG: energy transducer TonB [Gammaproteobacteria bacterium]|nr:MAG: energy transducer TonB [Gammaproteobacteria bacterium]
MRRALTVTSADRLVSTLFLAGIVHALVILGITFDLPKPGQASKSLEIVLVRQSSDRVPDKADFLAQANSLGSGESLEKKKIEERGRPQQIARNSGQQAIEMEKQSSQSSQKKVLVQQKSTKKISTADKEKKEDKPRKISAESLAMQISELSKELNMAEQNYAKRPRIKFINSMSAKSYIFAQYEAEWQRKIERIGNLNYPDEARRKRLAGRLLLVVLINSDGSLEKVELRSSSGHKILDDAAIRIVQLAAPFAVFPAEISKEYDQLAITRTWRFASDKVSTK